MPELTEPEKDFLNRTLRAWVLRPQINKWGLMKLKTSTLQKTPSLK